MTQETENSILTYFFKKSLCGMVLHVRVTSKEDRRNSTVLKCNEEQAMSFLLDLNKYKPVIQEQAPLTFSKCLECTDLAIEDSYNCPRCNGRRFV